MRRILVVVLSTVGCADLVGADFDDKSLAPRLCKPGDALVCYSGPSKTRDVGLCRTGTRLCGDQGTFGACQGEILPRAAEDLLTPEDDDCDGRAGTHRWTLTTGDAEPQEPLAVAIEQTGDVVVAGTFGGTMTQAFDMTAAPRDQDAFVVRVGSSGKPQSAGGLRVASAGADAIAAIGVEGDQMIVAGSLAGPADVGGIAVAADGDADAFVARLESAGSSSPWTAAWVVPLAGAGIQQAAGVSPSGGPGPVVAGWFDGSIELGETIDSVGEDAFVVGAGDAGIAWSLVFGGPGDDRAVSVAPLGAGVVVTAVVDGRVSVGTAMAGAEGKRSAIVTAIANGAHSWVLELGEVSTGLPRLARGDDRVAVASALRGSVLLDEAHESAGGDDLLVTTLAADGTPLSSRRFGGSGDERPTGIAMDGDEVVVTGTFAAPFEVDGYLLEPTGGTDGFLVRLRADATVAYARVLGGAQDQLPAAIAANDEATFVVGSFDEVLDLGSSPYFGDAADFFLSAFER